jgi:hypothetical protein
MTIFVPIMKLSERQGYLENQIQEDKDDVRGDFALALDSRQLHRLHDQITHESRVD